MAHRTVNAKFGHKDKWEPAHSDNVPGYATAQYYTRAVDTPDHEPSLERLIRVYNQQHHILMQARVVAANKVRLGLKKPGKGKNAPGMESHDLGDLDNPVDKVIPNPMDSVGESKPTTVKK